MDEGLAAAAEAPREVKDNLYQQVAHKALANGDAVRARQIIKDYVSTSQRRQLLAMIDQQAIRLAASTGKIEEALRGVSNLRTPRERAMMLSQIIGLIGPGLKRAAALALLEQARNQVGPVARAESQEQMGALLEIARVFAQYDSKRAFEVVEPLLDQFNEMAAAALVLNGFGQDFYEDVELMMQNGSSMANFGNQRILTLGSLPPANFDPAKAGADRARATGSAPHRLPRDRATGNRRGSWRKKIRVPAWLYRFTALGRRDLRVVSKGDTLQWQTSSHCRPSRSDIAASTAQL